MYSLNSQDRFTTHIFPYIEHSVTIRYEEAGINTKAVGDTILSIGYPMLKNLNYNTNIFVAIIHLIFYVKSLKSVIY